MCGIMKHADSPEEAPKDGLAPKDAAEGLLAKDNAPSNKASTLEEIEDYSDDFVEGSSTDNEQSDMGKDDAVAQIIDVSQDGQQGGVEAMGPNSDNSQLEVTRSQIEAMGNDSVNMEGMSTAEQDAKKDLNLLDLINQLQKVMSGHLESLTDNPLVSNYNYRHLLSTYHLC